MFRAVRVPLQVVIGYRLLYYASGVLFLFCCNCLYVDVIILYSLCLFFCLLHYLVCLFFLFAVVVMLLLLCLCLLVLSRISAVLHLKFYLERTGVVCIREVLAWFYSFGGNIIDLSGDISSSYYLLQGFDCSIGL